MEHISAFFDIEKVPSFKKGIEKGIEKGVEKGRHEANIATARKMKAEGYSDLQIAKLTDLKLSDIQRL